ncbi:hypothetical protein [Erysipelothrix tonsillarum]|uniref:hypothetical protein n=1 Tax=Erysipelothrix tonsillarum TaxID=38402 RepID=UPI00037DA307|nr:hypothetical protein [Erysipelothrix tonsillarum]
MKQWIVFMLSIGLLLIVLSSTKEQGLGLMITGLVLIIVSLWLLFRKSKGEK